MIIDLEHSRLIRVYPSDTLKTHRFLCHISYFQYFEILQN